MDEYLRLGVLLALVAPMAITDFKFRWAGDEIVFGGLAVACCFFAHDVLSGAFFGNSALIQSGVVLTIILGLVMVVMAWRYSLMGLPDAVIVLTISMMMPAMGGHPAGIVIVISGYIAAISFFMADYGFRNVRDVVQKKPYSSVFGMHVKRVGEKFTSKAIGAKPGIIANDTIYAADHTELFVDEKSCGMEVTTQIPMLTMHFAGICIAAALFHVVDPGLLPGMVDRYVDSVTG